MTDYDFVQLRNFIASLSPVEKDELYDVIFSQGYESERAWYLGLTKAEQSLILDKSY